MSVNIKTSDGLLPIAGNSGLGTNPEIESKLEELESLIEQTRALRTDLETYGMVKLSDSSAVTDSTGLALPATEKNASIEGTLANGILTIRNYLDDLKQEKMYYSLSSGTYELEFKRGPSCAFLLIESVTSLSARISAMNVFSGANKATITDIVGNTSTQASYISGLRVEISVFSPALGILGAQPFTVTKI